MNESDSIIKDFIHAIPFLFVEQVDIKYKSIIAEPTG